MRLQLVCGIRVEDMSKANSDRLKLVGAIICIMLAIAPLLPIYLISSGLLNNAVTLPDRSHFEMKLAIYIIEVVIFAALAIFLLRSRTP